MSLWVIRMEHHLWILFSARYSGKEGSAPFHSLPPGQSSLSIAYHSDINTKTIHYYQGRAYRIGGCANLVFSELVDGLQQGDEMQGATGAGE
ncbi:unnamed protein product [marine sediment metagenome]|uniref:Uncharacterized protein n=1 Tax=marine sediment metagenome TaxID=412755 RepID=X0RTZ9_9ZZZZ